MKIVNNQSYWRDLLDNTPSLILTFRIDESEEAQLIYVNHAIKSELGYEPEDFVLKSESGGLVAYELTTLIDRVAEVTKRKESVINHVQLTSINGEPKLFRVNFQLFRSRVTSDVFIQTLFIAEGKSVEREQHILSCEENNYICESELMKSLLNRLSGIAELYSNLLVTGESGVGKSRIIEKLLALPVFYGSKIQVLAESDTTIDINRFKESVDKGDVLYIKRAEELNRESLTNVLKLSVELRTRLIIESRLSINKLLESEIVSALHYYKLGFHNIIIPSLKQRQEDAVVYIRNGLNQFGKIIGEEIQISNDVFAFVRERKWDNNFYDLKTFIIETIKEMYQGRVGIPHAYLKPILTRQSTLFEEEDEGFEFLTYDEMNRKYLQAVLQKTRGKIYGEGGAAEILDLPPTTLQSKLKKLGVK